MGASMVKIEDLLQPLKIWLLKLPSFRRATYETDNDKKRNIIRT